MARAWSLVAENPAHTIGSLARELRLSPSWLERKFKEHCGRCLREHIQAERMTRAAHLLASTEKQIKEIAGLVGYAHGPSFTRAFLRHHRKTPRQLRLEAARG